MDYNITESDFSLSPHQTDIIDTRMGLSLSRFANLIAKCDLTFTNNTQQEPDLPVKCKIHILLHAGHEIEIEDHARELELCFSQAVARAKRSIERHLKHHRGPRLGSSMTTRT
ncbi:HPF/RaiA family ribosome-associated protein [Glaciecola siphonariae]|uniref:HPF/RaiA family ribosome-associated protein n=1 Tax=Glaciecola siphonariae TaxID=521012 RepID=A0ABV9LT06_9ALTE